MNHCNFVSKYYREEHYGAVRFIVSNRQSDKAVIYTYELLDVSHD